MNKVIGGYGEGSPIEATNFYVGFKPKNLGYRYIAKKTNNAKRSTWVASYEIVDKNTDISKSSAVSRGILGGIIGGTVGSVIGASTAKKHQSYTLLLHWNDSKDSLVEVDEKYYRAILKEIV